MLINVNANSVLLEVLIKGEEEGGVSHFVLEGSGLRPRGSLALRARGEWISSKGKSRCVRGEFFKFSGSNSVYAVNVYHRK